MRGSRDTAGRDRIRRKRVVVPGLAALEDRVVLSAAVAEVEIHYLRAIDHLNGMLQKHVSQVSTTLTRQASGLESQLETALGRSSALMSRGSAADVQKASTEIATATARAQARVDQLVARVQKQDTAFTASFDRQLAGVTGKYGKLSATLRSANPYFQGEFDNALNAINGLLQSEAQGTQGTVQSATSMVSAAVVQSRTAATPAVSVADVARTELATASQAQLASDRAAIANFENEYQSSFNPLRDELAAIASAELPPIELGSHGTVTGPDHGHGTRPGTINGTGTGTVTFTGEVGAEGTTGTGTGDETGVGGTGGTGTGTGTTTITGGGTNTTGVGSTVTAGNGANGNGVGSTTGTTGTTTSATGTSNTNGSP